jgi:phage-related holin
MYVGIQVFGEVKSGSKSLLQLEIVDLTGTMVQKTNFGDFDSKVTRVADLVACE